MLPKYSANSGSNSMGHKKKINAIGHNQHFKKENSVQ